ncbi:MAG: phosphatidate cytidylyltransferase [Eubacteriales bacterium]|nr:phosphatidate cytidylyltransferase [Eubacteriales bacterium]
MKQRIISGVVIAVLAIALGLVGGLTIALVLCGCALIGYYELVRACKVHGEGERTNALEVAGFAATVIYYFGLAFGGRVISANLFTLVVVIALVLVLMAIYVFTFPKYHADQVMAAAFCFIYAPVMISCIYRARLLPYGLYIYALIFFCSWICDTCAYASGMLFGKHKLVPVLSPKKTIEGSIGGVIGSALLCLGAAFVLEYQYPEEHLQLQFLIIGICGSIISQIGDLAASAIKRNHQIKDYGTCIPGHGGIMDRFDSVIFTAPIIYFLAVLFLQHVIG